MKLFIQIILLFFMACPIYGQTWQFIADGGQNLKDLAHDIEELSDGYIITGNLNSDDISLGNPDRCEIFLLKIDKEGNELWRQEYDFVNSTAYAVEVMADGGFLVGITFWADTDFGPFDAEIIVMRTDAQGNMEWTKKIDNGAYEYTIEELKVTPGAGGFILTGYVSETITENSSGWQDLFIYKGDDLGEMEWQLILGDTLVHERGVDIEELEQGGYVVGVRRFDIVTKNDYVAIRLDENGGIIWSQTFGTETSFENIASVEQAQDGNILLAGRWETTTNHLSKIIKINLDDGEEIWSQTLDGFAVGNDCGFIALTDDGGFAVGFRNRNPIFKFDANGNLEWSVLYDGDDDSHVIRQLISTSDGGLIAVGNYEIEGVDEDIYAIKMNGEGELTALSFNLELEEGGVQVYPNPAQDIIRVEVLGLSLYEEISYQIFSAYGELICTSDIVDETFSLNVSDWCSGFYVLKAVVKDKSISTVFSKI